MANTYCKGCAFAKSNENLEKSCEFHILTHIKDIKDISIKENYFYINNYKCKYAFSENTIINNNLDKQDIKNVIISKSHIQYYLVIDARYLNSLEQFEKLATDINNFNISPKLVSFLIDINKTNNENIYRILHKTIHKNIKWKLHAFLNEINFNEAANIAAETNIQTSESSLIYFWDCAISASEKTNDRINHVFFVRNIQQNNLFGFRTEAFDGLCIPITLYKSIITLINRDILHALSLTPDVSLAKYE